MAPPHEPSPPRVGILGGGQLARMLAESAGPLGLDVKVLTEAPADPAPQVCAAVIGRADESRVLRQFYSDRTLVTFENEFVETDRLGRLAAEFPALEFFPSLPVLNRLQDKRNQKELLDALRIPTAPWTALSPDQTPSSLKSRFPKGAVLKWSRMGYDGKGLLFWDPNKPDEALWKDFFESAAHLRSPLYAEERIAFRRELAILGCRSRTGEFAAYPLVRSRQDRGICSLVTGPARLLGHTVYQEKAAVSHAHRLAEALDYVGVLALELFETEEGSLLVNEIAPRVHNSGHYTQDACPTSQFENHWRAVLGLPLGDTRPREYFAMLNLLGPDRVECRAQEVSLPTAPPGARLHWYGKREIRPRRKLGHFNGTATDRAGLDKLVQLMEAADREWRERLPREGSSG